jgi:hypothetical protein
MEAADIAWKERGEATYPTWVYMKRHGSVPIGPFITENGIERPWVPTISDRFSRAWILVDREHSKTTAPRKWWQIFGRKS